MRVIFVLRPDGDVHRPTMNGNFATSFSGIEDSPLRVRAGVELSVEEPCEERALLVRRLAVAPAPRRIVALGTGLIDAGTKSAVLRRELAPGKLKSRMSMYGLFCTRENATPADCRP